jgi:hypothetical protein
MAYISLSDVALFLNATLNESGEAYLDAIIPQIEAAVEAACNRTWDTTTPQTEAFDGGVTRLFPSSAPISSVGALTVNGTSLEQNRDFYVMPGCIQFVYKISSGFQNVVLEHAQSNAPSRRVAGDDRPGRPVTPGVQR